MQFPDDDLLLSTEPPDEQFDVQAAKVLLGEFGDLFRSQLVVARTYSHLARHLVETIEDSEDYDWDLARIAATTGLARGIREGDFLPGGGGYEASFK